MTTARPRAKRARRSISELQREAPAIVRDASERGEVEITRYGEAVAYLVSPEERQRAQALEEAANRAMVAMEYKRAMEDWEAGHVLEWEEAEARLRAIVGDL